MNKRQNYFKNENCVGSFKCKRTRKNLMTQGLNFALDTCKISDQGAIHNITACIEAESLSIDDFIPS